MLQLELSAKIASRQTDITITGNVAVSYPLVMIFARRFWCSVEACSRAELGIHDEPRKKMTSCNTHTQPLSTQKLVLHLIEQNRTFFIPCAVAQ